MRMRKKKNLEEKLELCDNLIIKYTDDRNYMTAADVPEYFDFTELFGNSNPVHLEVGCGKGQFVYEIAMRNPHINYLAVEKSSNVIVTACEKCKELPNIRFLKCGAEYLAKYIRPDSISRIYLNFSCPFPKKAYASHRLTATHFLRIYDKIMCDGAEIHQKTDNRGFFEFSIEKLSGYGFTLKNISLDLHNSNFEGNIVTEYEARFSALGCPIYRLEAYLKNENSDC
ncbi:MAG: tRNA (guanosine(46)-N7)-methyltransferase TrmB [Acutalibacteraceae bacterium]|nr:tRNA (guanosine(46)-N7)-methyltransferase TrmB [Acutalibacteraceae bacterium]